MDNKAALQHADTVVDGYAVITSKHPAGWRADVPQYPVIFAIEATEDEAKAAARECLRQHLAAQIEQGRQLLPHSL